MQALTPIRNRNSLSRRQGRGSFLTGCLIALAVVVVLVVVGGIYAWTQWRGVAASLATKGITVAVQQLELSPEDEQLILARVDQVAEDFKAKKVTIEQLGKVATKLMESPVAHAVGVYAVEKNYFRSSGLSAEEKENASLQLDRLARGVYEKKITPEEMQDAMDEIVVQSANNNNIQFREPESVDDDDLRQLITEVTAAADEAEIPNEPFEIDIAAEFIKAIDEALGTTSAEGTHEEGGEEHTEEGGQEGGEEHGGEGGEGGGGGG